jgi:two-component system chemotaxis response regulator CheY
MTKIMVVDDAAFMRQMLKQIIAELGYEVIADAANGEEAVKMYSQMQPDLVTMDITMPEMDGIEAVRAIRKINPAAKIIMCSAMAQQKLVIDAITAGAKDFVAKPFQAEKIKETIQRVLAL